MSILPLADVFSSSQDPAPDMTPPTPTLAAVAPKKASHVALGQLGGLDALEARLLAEVGTRKMDQDSARPDVRAVLPIAIPKPDAAIDPAIDSAISSLSLQGLGADEGTLRLGKDDVLAEPSEKGRQLGSEVGSGEANDDASRPSKESGKKVRKRTSGQKIQGEVVKEKEQHRLRKAAQGRIAAWLGTIDPETPPERGTPTPEESPRLTEAVMKESSATNKAQKPPAKPVLPASPSAESTAGTTKAVDAKPNPRSSGFMPIRPGKRPLLLPVRTLLPITAESRKRSWSGQNPRALWILRFGTTSVLRVVGEVDK